MNKVFLRRQTESKKTLFTDSSFLIFKRDKSYLQSMLLSVICYSGKKFIHLFYYNIIFLWNVGVNDSQSFLFFFFFCLEILKKYSWEYQRSGFLPFFSNVYVSELFFSYSGHQRTQLIEIIWIHAFTKRIGAKLTEGKTQVELNSHFPHPLHFPCKILSALLLCTAILIISM